MELLYVGPVHEAQKIFVFLIIGFIPISVTSIFGVLLTASGNLKELNLMALTGMIVNISLNFLLIPTLMAVGSAYASLATQFITAILEVVIAQSVFRFTINWKYVLTLVFFVAGVIVISWFSNTMVWDWRILFVATGIASVIWIFILRLLSIGGFIRLMKGE